MIEFIQSQDNVKLFDGGNHIDDRGEICFVNTVPINDFKRFYTISNKSVDVIRAWQAHKLERKAFHVVQGVFLIATVKLDDFDNPSDDLDVLKFKLDAKSAQILMIPPGYANGIRALSENNKLLVFSTMNLKDSSADTFRFPCSKWFDWRSK
ncbi:MAG: hypothetical protein U5R06_03770 [candidate division KSB1 bacterium]|nr:hypothetical protein [candidate division KSB1 bacterium]